MSFNRLFNRNNNNNNNNDDRPAPTPQNTQRDLGALLDQQDDNGNANNNNNGGLNANHLQAALANAERRDDFHRQDSLSTIETIQTIDTKTSTERRQVLIHMGSGDYDNTSPANNNTNMGGLMHQQQPPAHTVMLGAFLGGGNNPNNNNNTNMLPRNMSSTTAPADNTTTAAAKKKNTNYGAVDRRTPGGKEQQQARELNLNDNTTTNNNNNNNNTLPILPDEHDFEYHHPDYDDPYAPKTTPCCYKWCCLCQPFVRCWHAVWHDPTLQRSFCYGGIDGMLTGAGIVAAFYGTGLLTNSLDNLQPDDNSSILVMDDDNNQQHARRLLLLYVSMAACWADALCLALGHVWTTRCLAAGHVAQRARARVEFHHDTAAAKGQLVQSLLQQGGMLKIDAMSLADTLEGYPDLFVSALLGEALTTGGNDNGGPNMMEQSQAPADPLASPLHSPHAADANQIYHLRTIPSYGGHNPALDMEDADAFAIRQTVQEAWKESICMFAGFAVWAMVPSAICYALPWVFELMGSGSGDNASSDDTLRRFLLSQEEEMTDDNEWAPFSGETDGVEPAGFIQPGTLFVFLMCLIMGGLGTWKSKFHANDGNNNAWVFALEAVAVLLIGMSAGYGLGLLLTQYLSSLEFALVVVSKQQ